MIAVFKRYNLTIFNKFLNKYLELLYIFLFLNFIKYQNNIKIECAKLESKEFKNRTKITKNLGVCFKKL